LKQFLNELLNREDLLPGVLKEFSLITEHLTEIKVDLQQYQNVSDDELLKLLSILKQKNKNRFVIVTITLPDRKTVTTYMNTYKHSDVKTNNLSELDTLLSLYMEVNSGA
jgi:ABC-type enterochelin transport system ATPase subunit